MGTANRTPIGGICASHQQIFFKVARALGVWILVRATNKSSIKYIGPAYPDIVPKPKGCDAKTADQGPKAGLVVCPLIDPHAFSPERLEEAESTWNKWAPEWIPYQFEKSFLDRGLIENRGDLLLHDQKYSRAGLPLPFAVLEDRDSPYYACVVSLQDGNPKLMHGDYDLYDVVDPTNVHLKERFTRTFNGSSSFYGPKTAKVQDALNQLMTDGRASTALIQHGEHLAKFDHKEDMIYAFSPNEGDGLIIVYPFAFGLESIRSLYAKIFQGRTPTSRHF